MIGEPVSVSHYKAQVKKSLGFEEKLVFDVQSQTESWYKVRLMQNIFMIKYILIHKYNFS